MWDQPLLPKVTVHTVRIIPTYVGSTIADIYFGVLIANHSHVCGINTLSPHANTFPLESFPRMWDQRDDMNAAVWPGRIIPTYVVGSTGPFGVCLGYSSNHSHVCGIN